MVVADSGEHREQSAAAEVAVGDDARDSGLLTRETFHQQF